MKLSKETISILKNFSTINPSIEIKVGNSINTISQFNRTVLAMATVPETFTQSFAIYDISKFLGCLSLFSEPELTFHEKYVSIEQGGHKIRYTYCEPSNIVTPPNKTISLGNEVVNFILPTYVLPAINKSLGILGLPDIRICSDGVYMSIMASNRERTGDEYSIKLGECNKEFDVYFDRKHVLMIPDREYEITMTPNGLSEWKTENLKYYIAGKAQ